MKQFILASNSPRRKELLKTLIDDFKVVKSNSEEVIADDIPYEEAIMDIAFDKALDVFQTHKEDIVLGFDTLVYLDDELLGKPKSKEDAFRMLRLLSGKNHFVVTGCAIISKEVSYSFYEKTEVVFSPLTDQEIEDYINTGEPMDKAGSYGIQGYGARFVKRVYGDYYNVMGLPISKVYDELKKHGLFHQNIGGKE